MKGKIIGITSAVIILALAAFIYVKFCFVFGDGVEAGIVTRMRVILTRISQANDQIQGNLPLGGATKRTRGSERGAGQPAPLSA